MAGINDPAVQPVCVELVGVLVPGCAVHLAGVAVGNHALAAAGARAIDAAEIPVIVGL